MNSDMRKVHPLDSFAPALRVLAWAGFHKPPAAPARAHAPPRTLCRLYRLFALLFTLLYNLQHLIFIAQHRNDMDKVMDCLVIEIPQINLLSKVLTMFFQSGRIDQIHDVLKGPALAAADGRDEAILRKDMMTMHRLVKVLLVGVTAATFLWPMSYFVKRYYDENELVNSYMPFEADTWLKFSLSVFMECGTVLWTGYGHISLDCLIATYYAQAQTQLKIMKYQLENLLPNVKEQDEEKNFRFIDVNNQALLERFIKIVKRYETIVWYTNEVDTAFNGFLSVQFLTSASAVCLVIFRMSSLNITYLPFLALLFCLLLTQVFLYCYYGNLVEVESESVAESAYMSAWVSASPRVRRLLLVAMCRWSRPLRPRVAGIIPLSLTTFISILKSSYTLYTVLGATASRSDFKH